MVLSVKLAEELPWSNFQWEPLVKIVFSIFLVNIISLNNFFFLGGGGFSCVCHICCVLKKKTLFGCILTKMHVLNSTFRVKVIRTLDWHRNNH